MARIHGKNAVIYLGASSAVAATPVSEMADWSIDMDVATVDVSSLNQTWKNSLKGMFGWSGTFSGNFNTASNQLWTAATDNTDTPIKFYLYPTLNNMGAYYYGTGWVQLNKIAAGSTTAKASSGFKITGDGELGKNA